MIVASTSFVYMNIPLLLYAKVHVQMSTLNRDASPFELSLGNFVWQSDVLYLDLESNGT